MNEHGLPVRFIIVIIIKMFVVRLSDAMLLVRSYLMFCLFCSLAFSFFFLFQSTSFQLARLCLIFHNICGLHTIDVLQCCYFHCYCGEYILVNGHDLRVYCEGNTRARIGTSGTMDIMTLMKYLGIHERVIDIVVICLRMILDI